MTISEANKLKSFDLIYIHPKDGGPKVIGKFGAILQDRSHLVRVLMPVKDCEYYEMDYVGICNIEKYYPLNDKLDKLLELDKKD